MHNFVQSTRKVNYDTSVFLEEEKDSYNTEKTLWDPMGDLGFWTILRLASLHFLIISISIQILKI